MLRSNEKLMSFHIVECVIVYKPGMTLEPVGPSSACVIPHRFRVASAEQRRRRNLFANGDQLSKAEPLCCHLGITHIDLII